MSSATLIVLGDDLDPDFVSNLLGVLLDQKWRRGELKSIKRKNGSVLRFKSRYKWGGWKSFLNKSEDKKELPQQIAIWCDRLLLKKNAVRKLQKLNYWIVIDCCIVSSGAESIRLDAKIHKKLSDLKIDLDITFYSHRKKD
jgi:hypothetical protein